MLSIRYFTFICQVCLSSKQAKWIAIAFWLPFITCLCGCFIWSGICFRLLKLSFSSKDCHSKLSFTTLFSPYDRTMCNWPIRNMKKKTIKKLKKLLHVILCVMLSAESNTIAWFEKNKTCPLCPCLKHELHIKIHSLCDISIILHSFSPYKQYLTKQLKNRKTGPCSAPCLKHELYTQYSLYSIL